MTLRFSWKLPMSKVNKSHDWEIPNEKLHTTIDNETLQGRWLLWPRRTLSKPPLSADVLSWSLWQSFGLRGKQLYTLAAFWRNSVVYLPSLKPIVHSPLTMLGYWPLPSIIGCYWGVSSQSQKHLRPAMATIRLEPTSNFARSPNTSNTTHVPYGTQRIQALSFLYICRHTFSRQSAK